MVIGAVVYVDVRPFEDKIGVLMAVGFGSLVVNWRIAVHNGRIIQNARTAPAGVTS